MFPSQENLPTTQEKMEWVQASELVASDWPAEVKHDEAYSTSPLSSPGIYTPADVGSWNYFDHSFSKAVEPAAIANPSIATYPNAPYPTRTPYPSWNSAEAQAANTFDSASQTFVPLALIHNPAQFEIDNDSEENEGTIRTYQPPSPESMVNRHQYAHRASWSTPNCSRRNSSTTTRSVKSTTRSKEKEIQTSRMRRDSFSSTTKHQLRSTKTGHKINYTENSEPRISESPRGARTSHNLVEKQYRTRLNGQFSTLLSVLPAENTAIDLDGMSKVDMGDVEKRVSKAEVLILAKKHIEDLEREKRELEEHRRNLLSDVQRLKGAWTQMGGEVMF